MIRSAIAAVLVLGACGEGQKPPETPLTPTTEAAPAAATGSQAALATNEIAPPAGQVTVTTPASGARVTSPLVVEGTADNTWFFEGVFPVELSAEGQTLIVAPAEQQEPDNWTNPGPVRFRAELPFTVSEERAAVVILREDMPRPETPDSDVAGPARTIRIPVTLVPAG